MHLRNDIVERILTIKYFVCKPMNRSDHKVRINNYSKSNFRFILGIEISKCNTVHL